MLNATRALLVLLTIMELVGFAHAAVTMRWVPADDPGGNTPAGYTAWDLMATVTTNLGTQEMVVNTDTLGDIYQNTSLGSATYTEPNPAGFALDPALEFDTYVTFGAWSYETPTNIMGGAFHISGSITETFDTQDLDIFWAPSPGSNSGPGEFQVARLTLKDTAIGTWQYRGQQTGEMTAEIVGGDIVNGVPLPEPATFGLGVVLLGGCLLLRRKSQ